MEVEAGKTSTEETFKHLGVMAAGVEASKTPGRKTLSLLGASTLRKPNYRPLYWV